MTVTIPPADLQRFVSEVQDLRDVVNASIGKDTEIATVEGEIETLNETLDQKESLLSLKKSEKEDLVLQASMQVDHLENWLKYFRGEGPLPTDDPTPAPAPTPSTPSN